MGDVVRLNADAQSGGLDHAALDAAIRVQGTAFQQALSAAHAHLFADVPLYVTEAQLAQMQTVIEAVERVVKLPGWIDDSTEIPAQGVFYGYDFHLNVQGAHLIEINTNAGGAFLNALLIGSQRVADFPGKTVALDNLEDVFLGMFRNEWRLERGDVPLNTVCIVDDQPEGQYLYPEFLLARAMFGRAGITAYIADPAALLARQDGLYLDGTKIDLVYNRLTDFTLQQHPALRRAHLDKNVVLTPAPAHYARYADKRNLARLSDVEGLRKLGANAADIAVLQAGVPHTIIVQENMEESLWAERKQWFFKPNSGYGSKGAYRGEKLTRRVFGEIMKSDYVAQRLAAPGEREICDAAGDKQSLKCDVRCYAYGAQIQLVAARLYQGQTTNFRTPGGGFALVRVVE
ncbi:MAG: hypothetical protein HY016_09290 [Nitrosomonadales bacterium]|nr:hypothetical protein [Nitrosomonadales bacterium]